MRPRDERPGERVTLDKDEADFTPTTLDNDDLLSPHRFHWESQGNTPADGSTERRHREHVARGWRIIMFVRRAKKEERSGITPPNLCLGPVRYDSHQGSKPMQVIWRLEHPAPADWYQSFEIAAGLSFTLWARLWRFSTRHDTAPDRCGSAFAPRRMTRCAFEAQPRQGAAADGVVARGNRQSRA